MTRAKRTAQRSYRALAADAGVAASTITRIESKATDPTFATLERLLHTCGFELTPTRAVAADRPHLAELADAWQPDRDDQPELAWTTWRALLDRLALHPEWVPEAIYVPPPPAGHPAIDALLAAVAEKLADDAGLARPTWTATVPPPPQPYAPPARRRGDVPVQFAARQVLIDGASLFRDAETVGA